MIGHPQDEAVAVVGEAGRPSLLAQAATRPARLVEKTAFVTGREDK
jgi:hypothetical protein